MPILAGLKWGDPDLGTAGGVVTWSIVGGGENISEFDSSTSVDGSSFLTLDFEDMLRDGFAKWAAEGDVEFVQVADLGGGAGDTAHPDIRVFFGPIFGDIIGFGFFPSSFGSPIAGDILLDNAATFNFDVSLFEALIVHEIGHAVGLEHVSRNSVMTPRVSATELQADDIDGITQIYGPQDGAAAVYDMPEGETELRMLHNPETLTVNGNALGNLITGTIADETINGAGGDDTLSGGGGDDRLDGGGGNDLARFDTLNRADADLSVMSGRLRVASAAAQAELSGIETIRFADETVEVAALITEILGPPGDVITGSAGDEVLSGTENRDTITGGGGDDTLSGGAGHDELYGGGGNDIISASAGNDIIAGGGDDDNIGGGPGDDTMTGGAGNDTLGGGQGNDSANGGGGDDVVNGGAGDDILSGDQGNDTVGAGFNADSIQGGGGDDSLGGGTGRDTVNGGAGNDDLGGGEGDDTVTGGDGNDFAAGGGRNDVIDGGAGNDRINGGDGNDTMTGGDGADVFIYNFFKAGDEDVITDYEDGLDSFRIRIISTIDGSPNIENSGNGLQGFVDDLNITQTAAGAQMNVDGHLILLEGFDAALLGTEDFVFV